MTISIKRADDVVLGSADSAWARFTTTAADAPTVISTLSAGRHAGRAAI